MATLGSKLLTKVGKGHANLTEQNHLGLALMTKPHIFTNVMNQIFSSQNYYSGNPISKTIWEMGAEEIGTTEWEWSLKNAETRPLVVIENVEPSANTTPGKCRTTFKIKLDENWFLPSDIIHPGTSSKKYFCRIQDGPVRHGNGWVYTVRLAKDGFNELLPVKYLKPGQQWAKAFSQIEEGSEEKGSTQYGSSVTFRNKMGKFGKKYDVTDYAASEVLQVAIPLPNGGYTTSWIKYAEVEYWQQWYNELDRARVYSPSYDTVLGSTGRQVRAYPGIQDQLADSHIHRYSFLSAKLIEEYLMDIFYGRIKPGVGRKVKCYTGEYGMIQFARVMNDWMAKNSFIKFVQPVQELKTKADFTGNTPAIGLGYQAVKYFMMNGCELEVVHMPLYDARDQNFEIDPVSGYPMESQRFTFIDFVGKGTESNLKVITKKDGFAFNYVNGLVGPTGPLKGGTAAHSGDYYTMNCIKTEGIQITDITKCGELILSRG